MNHKEIASRLSSVLKNDSVVEVEVTGDDAESPTRLLIRMSSGEWIQVTSTHSVATDTKLIFSVREFVVEKL